MNRRGFSINKTGQAENFAEINTMHKRDEETRVMSF
jgi:hypothetical protein